jgi:hypothetical protein
MVSPARPGARLEVESTTPTASAVAMTPARVLPERWPKFVEVAVVRRCPQAARPACR